MRGLINIPSIIMPSILTNIQNATIKFDKEITFNCPHLKLQIL